MKREIKFRGKSVSTGEWVFGSLVNNLWVKSELTPMPGLATCEILTTDNPYDCWSDMEDNGNAVEVIPETVGQYTGLKDMNGKEIYEGDIISVKGWTIAKIVWNEAVCSFQYSYPNMDNHWVTSTLYDFEAVKKYEIVGNIFEHPELLNTSTV